MNNKKFIAAVAAGALALGCTIGGTVAWLTAKTDTITNTFTVGDINITLTEPSAPANYDFAFVPGDTFTKDPTVTVAADSEACYLFVKVTAENNEVTVGEGKIEVIDWAVDADIWTAVPGKDGYWYKEVDKTTAATPYTVLDDNTVTVNTAVTKDMVEGLTAKKPTISVTAAAVQKDNVTTVADAFAKLPSDF